MIPLAIVAGYLAGLIVACLTVTAEHSRIAFGSYALYGNGAIIVLAILAPVRAVSRVGMAAGA